MARSGTGGDRDPRPPLTSLLFGYGPMAPLPIAALVAWLAPPPWPIIATWLGIWWGAAILIFIAGVRRGLSFRSEDEPRPGELMTMLWLFVLGAGAFAMPTPLLSLALLILGYASVAILDPVAAHHGGAPAHFARLRPPQMAIALVGLVGLMLWRIAGTMPL